MRLLGTACLIAAVLIVLVASVTLPSASAQSGGFSSAQTALNVEATAIGTQPTAGTAGGLRRVVGTVEGVPFVIPGAPNKFTCRVAAVTAATQCQAQPAAGLKVYVTDMLVSNNVGTAQTIKLVTGTGTNCATGTADLTHAVQFGAAVGNFGQAFQTPPQPPVDKAVCVTPSAATSISATLSGYIAP